MRYFLKISYVLIVVVLVGCINNNISTGNIETESKVTYDVLQELNEDLNKDNNLEEIKLILHDEKKKKILKLVVGNEICEIQDVAYNPESFHKKPQIKILEALTDKKIMFITSYKVNGSEEGMYDVRIFNYRNNNIKEIWKSDLELKEIKFNLKNEHLLIEIPQFNLSQTLDFKSYDYSRIQRVFKDSSQDVVDKLNIRKDIGMIEAEKFSLIDLDDDGEEELILHNPIYYDPAWSYISSLFTIWKLEEDKIVLKKSFVLDRKGLDSRIIEEIMDNGFVEHGNWGETISKWIDYGYNGYTKRDIENAIESLLDLKIVEQYSGIYKLNF